jgi:hypothetical protein
MNRLLLAACCAVWLSAAASAASASTDIRLWPHHHKDSNKASVPAKPKEKHGFLHRGKGSREQAARSETSNGMPGPKSVGWRHPQPGPAGVGAK